MTGRRRPVTPPRASEAKSVTGLSLTTLLAAAASPVVIFYGAGYLLAFGYFFGMGPALMTAFGPTELALVGFARLSGAVAACAFLAFIAITISYVVAANSADEEPRLTERADFVGAAVCLAGMIFIIVAGLRAGFLGTLVALVAILVMGGIAIALVIGKEEWLRRREHPWRWMLPLIMLLLGLPSLGEAGFDEATQDNRAQWITVVVDGQPVGAKLLMLGAGAMIYQVVSSHYLAGPRGESPMKLEQPEKSFSSSKPSPEE